MRKKKNQDAKKFILHQTHREQEEVGVRIGVRQKKNVSGATTHNTTYEAKAGIGRIII